MKLDTLKLSDIFLISLQICESKIANIQANKEGCFPYRVDYSIVHSQRIIKYLLPIINKKGQLNEDEKYILVMVVLLHKIGFYNLYNKEYSKHEKESENDYYLESAEFIRKYWKGFGILSEDYAEAIALVITAHRSINLFDFDIYTPHFVVRNGTDFICIPYLAVLLKLGVCLDITKDRVCEIPFSTRENDHLKEDNWREYNVNRFISFREHSIIITSSAPDISENSEFKLKQVLTQIQELIKRLIGEKRIFVMPYKEVIIKRDFVNI